MRISYIVIPLLIGAGAYGWYWKQNHPYIIPVTVSTVQKGDVEATVANTRAGTVKACRRAKMSPSIGGQISDLPYKEGESVKKGDVLLRVWNNDLLAEIVRIKESIIVARDTAKASCLRANTAERSADRARQLIKSKTISRESYDNSFSEAQVRVAECQVANDNISVTQASLKGAEARLKRTILVAPFNGVIAKINGELNEYVTPSPPGILTPPVIDLIEPGCFFVSVPIDEVDAPKVKIGLPARITLDAWRGRIFDATVSRIGSYVVDREKQARTVDIELRFNDAKDLKVLLVGYSADADIILQTKKDVLRIPSEAMLDDSHVLVFNPENRLLEKKTIKKGLTNWSFTEVLEGIKKGDKLVTSLSTEGVEAGVLAEIANPKETQAKGQDDKQVDNETTKPVNESTIESEIEADFKKALKPND